ncbi:MAG: hypothetical protein ACJ8FV_18960, partial [Xanthobacteraceae bacterium]
KGIRFSCQPATSPVSVDGSARRQPRFVHGRPDVAPTSRDLRSGLNRKNSMSRGTCIFRQRDVTRALRAMAAAGVHGRVEIEPNGKIVLIPGNAESRLGGGVATATGEGSANDFGDP